MEGQVIEVTQRLTPVVPVKKEVTYEEKVAKMSDRQLSAELRRHKRNDERPRINGAFATVLSILMENHAKGMNPFINRTTKFEPFVIK